MRELFRDLRTYHIEASKPLNITERRGGECIFEPKWNSGLALYHEAAVRLRKHRVFRWYEKIRSKVKGYE